mmetsp:Transcript_40110/g.110422  ORF Transcript_40110/g.110422 Transcript_40110/m.110422 type:complete len:404 (+) Transcript_40110:1491-2702(+)
MLGGRLALEQQPEAIEMAEVARQQQRRRAAQRRLGGRRAVRDEKPHGCSVARGARVVQRYKAFGRVRVDQGTRVQQRLHDRGPLGRVRLLLGRATARKVERRPAVVVGHVRVGAVLQQRLHRLHMPLARSCQRERAAIVVTRGHVLLEHVATREQLAQLVEAAEAAQLEEALLDLELPVLDVRRLNGHLAAQPSVVHALVAQVARDQPRLVRHAALLLGHPTTRTTTTHAGRRAAWRATCSVTSAASRVDARSCCRGSGCLRKADHLTARGGRTRRDVARKATVRAVGGVLAELPLLAGCGLVRVEVAGRGQVLGGRVVSRRDALLHIVPYWAWIIAAWTERPHNTSRGERAIPTLVHPQHGLPALLVAAPQHWRHRRRWGSTGGATVEPHRSRCCCGCHRRW